MSHQKPENIQFNLPSGVRIKSELYDPYSYSGFTHVVWSPLDIINSYELEAKVVEIANRRLRTSYNEEDSIHLLQNPIVNRLYSDVAMLQSKVEALEAIIERNGLDKSGESTVSLEERRIAV